jgi:carboxypeptidase PM20D1
MVDMTPDTHTGEDWMRLLAMHLRILHPCDARARNRPMNITPRSLASRIALVLALAVAIIITIVLARTFAAGKAKATSLREYSVPAIDASAALENLRAALRFETVIYDDAAPAEAFAQFRDWLIVTYPRFHATTLRTVVGGGTLIHEWRGSDTSLPPIVLMAHQDVVPVPQPERWRQPPFSGALVDGEIWGRGALDDKGSLIAILEAAESLLRSGHTPTRTVIFVFGHDEEIGGPGALEAATLLASRGVKAAFVLDEGGLTLSDPPVANGPMSLIGIAEKGYLTLKIEANVLGGHSNAPGRQTAVDTLARAIIAIRSEDFPPRYAGVTRTMLESMAPHAPFVTRMAIANHWLFEPLLVEQLTATPQGAATLQTTIAPTMLQGSPKQNVLPSVASATINLRIMPGETLDSVMAHVRESLDGIPVTLSRIGPSVEPSPIASTETGGYRLVSELVAKEFGAPVAPLLMIGLTDSRHMRVLTDDIYRFTPVELGSKDMAIVHGFDERLSVEDFNRMIRFYAQVIVGGSAAVLP